MYTIHAAHILTLELHLISELLVCLLLLLFYCTVLGHVGTPAASNPGWDSNNPWKTAQTMSYQHVILIYVFKNVLARILLALVLKSNLTDMAGYLAK